MCVVIPQHRSSCRDERGGGGGGLGLGLWLWVWGLQKGWKGSFGGGWQDAWLDRFLKLAAPLASRHLPLPFP